jgi:hypothetical protein
MARITRPALSGAKASVSAPSPSIGLVALVALRRHLAVQASAIAGIERGCCEAGDGKCGLGWQAATRKQQVRVGLAGGNPQTKKACSAIA